MFGYERALRMLFTDRCDIYERRSSVREDGVTVFTEELVRSGVPCRISYDTYPSAKQNDRTAHTTGSAVLFLPVGTDVAAGSIVTVTRDGREIPMKASGLPKVYPGHLEITVRPAQTEA